MPPEKDFLDEIVDERTTANPDFPEMVKRAHERATLKQLIEKARTYVMSDDERREQRINFAYGNLALSNPDITVDDIRKADLSSELVEKLETLKSVEISTETAYQIINLVLTRMKKT